MKDTEVIGFGGTEELNENEEDEDISDIKKKASKKSGGFQSMALSYPILKGILKRGYKIPTPIQRKVSMIQILLYSKFKKEDEKY